ncbi:hypothetical protein G2W53_019350 [Senna tora]|uniref:Peptidase C45 hydrolase domain-containing protein n=1 Tax=Senna tora TaxID=362788 RepID=A0A834WQL6_9FABA|nr:hypothetical protein G2W53_019350 [Senna tora]
MSSYPLPKPPNHTHFFKLFITTIEPNSPLTWILGTAHGSDVPFLHILLINFRKEILALIPKGVQSSNAEPSEDCSDLLVLSESMAIAAHNEDANVGTIIGHTYLIKAILPNGQFFIAYTYPGELPSCAFGFNSHGLAFTLNSVAPTLDEIVAGAIGRNFVSRDILEATSIDDALNRICSSEVSLGHNYNLIETSTRRILNVETASRKRVSVYEVQDENSISRQQRAAVLEKKSKEDFLSLLGDNEDSKYPIYTKGPLLHTLCTAVIDLDEQTLSILKGNPKKGDVLSCFLSKSNLFKKTPSCISDTVDFTLSYALFVVELILLAILQNLHYQLGSDPNSPTPHANTIGIHNSHSSKRNPPSRPLYATVDPWTLLQEALLSMYYPLDLQALLKTLIFQGFGMAVLPSTASLD